MKKLELYLKSGHTVKVECEQWDFTYDKETCQYTGYMFTGMVKPTFIGLVPSQIVGYTSN